ncbi:MAG: hypothetical protein ORO03_06710 [Alphaproteobacteria bacterium]|nr:hypothetical protein [Alphaproteobacteria bacterium]
MPASSTTLEASRARWRLRLVSFGAAVDNLTEALTESESTASPLLVRDAVIKRYEIAYELA